MTEFAESARPFCGSFLVIAGILYLFWIEEWKERRKKLWDAFRLDALARKEIRKNRRQYLVLQEIEDRMALEEADLLEPEAEATVLSGHDDSPVSEE